MASAFEAERQELISTLKTIRTGGSGLTDDYLLRLFTFQYKYNNIYREYCCALKINAKAITRPGLIPPLPISVFRHHRVVTGQFEEECVFRSSGTTSQQRSQHHVRSVEHYLENASAIWASVFSPPENTCFLALLPGYLERQDSSLVCMVAHFIGRSAYRQSGFFLYDHTGLARQLEKNKMENVPTVLFGVSFALADFAENHSIAFPDLTIIETGGMKGSKKELSREALQKLLSASFGVKKVYSEYGMTELLSQAYTSGGQYFHENAVLQVRTYQVSDPLTPEKAGKPGMLAVTDLANIDSCAFLLTEDLGVRLSDGMFSVLGRLDDAGLRGCNLLLEEVV